MAPKGLCHSLGPLGILYVMRILVLYINIYIISWGRGAYHVYTIYIYLEKYAMYEGKYAIIICIQIVTAELMPATLSSTVV